MLPAHNYPLLQSNHNVYLVGFGTVECIIVRFSMIVVCCKGDLNTTIILNHTIIHSTVPNQEPINTLTHHMFEDGPVLRKLL